VDALHLKVSQELSDAVTHRDQPTLTDYDGWCRLYQKVYDNLQDQSHYNKLRAGQQTFRGQKTTDRPQQSRQIPIPTAIQTTGDPMQLDVMRPRPSREECTQQNLCFYCKKPGNRCDQCDEKRKNDARFDLPQNSLDPKSQQRFNPS
jgi:hypothetical protein